MRLVGYICRYAIDNYDALMFFIRGNAIGWWIFMKRDMVLVRKLLFDIEENHILGDEYDSSGIVIPGYSEKEIIYNLHLMVDGGLVEVMNCELHEYEEYGFMVHGLTWNGHDFLDAVRSDSIWNQVLTAIKPLGTVAFAVAQSLAVAYSLRAAGQ